MASSPFSLTYTPGLRIAVIVTGIIGTISALAVTSLLVHLFAALFASMRRHSNKDEQIFLRKQLGVIFVCLLFSDLIQALSGVIQLIWASRGGIDSRSLCTAQAVMIQLGDNGTAFWNSAIAFHTFWTLVLRKHMSNTVVALIIATGWTACAVLTSVGPLAVQTQQNGPFYANAGLWCFIPAEYKYFRVYLHFVPMLISAAVITILYAIVALSLTGVLVVEGKRWRIGVPTRHRNKAAHESFSAGRLDSSSPPTYSMPLTSNGIKSYNVRRGSSHLGYLPPRKSDAEAGYDTVFDGSSITARFNPFDAPRPSTSTSNTTTSDASLERGGGNMGIIFGNQDSKKDKKQPTEALKPISMANQVNGKALPVKKLAIKVLAYPIAYVVLVMPITVARLLLDRMLAVEILVAFMCLLWLMGTVNTIIYICTRRLGPTLWWRRSKAAPTLQVYVNSLTQRVVDDHFVHVTNGKGKPVASSFPDADVPVINAMPPVAYNGSGNGENVQRDYGNRRFGFDYARNPQRHSSLHRSSLSGPPTNAYPLSQRPLPQQPVPIDAPAALRRSIQQQTREHPVYQEPHPYARAHSPTLSHDSHGSFLVLEDGRDTLRTQRRVHRPEVFGARVGGGMAL